MMKKNIVKQRLREGKPSIGTWLSIPSPYTSELMVRAGFDWVVIDMEHNPISIETAGLMVSSTFASDTVPLIRIPWNNVENIKRALDIGAWGIVVPMVKSRREAEAVIHEAKYFPEGGRSVGGTRHAMGFETDVSTYYRNANDEIAIIVQIEHIEAVQNIDDILTVPGIDACFIGPNDLMSSMGLVPSLVSDLPEVANAIETIKVSAARHGVASGIHVPDAITANRRISEGFQFIAIGSELSFMLKQTQQEIGLLVDNALHSNATNKEIRY